MAKKISEKDKKDWEDFLSRKDPLPVKDNVNVKKKINKTFTFDLHGYSLSDANNKIEDLIHQSYNNGIHKLLIVTGKGLHSNNEMDPYVSKELGILKNSVPAFIRNNKKLMSLINDIKDADIEDGGSGSFYIFLKKNYRINFDKSVSFTKLFKFLLIYSLLITIFSPDLSVAVKLISSSIFSIIVCNLLAPIFSTVELTSEAIFAIASIPSSENSRSTFSVFNKATYCLIKL